jgi:transposase
MDTHKKQHSVAVMYPGTSLPQQFTVNNSIKDMARMIKKIKQHAAGQIHACYEAGVCGFVLKRQLEALGCNCTVVAPSLVPVKPGERIKTDRRDAIKLLGHFIAGQLTAVYPPNEQQEAARELTRCRQTAQENLKRIRHQLVKFLTRHGYIYTDGEHWTAKHNQWLRSLVFDLPDLREVFEMYYAEMQHCIQRLISLDKQLEQLAERPEYRRVVGLLRCFRGIDILSAVTLVTELFEFGRFATPEQLMSYLGLVPSESSSGDKSHHGPITKTGNKRIRRLLIESSWHYHHRLGISKELERRRRGQPQWVIDIADQAMVRLHKRYWRLLERGKSPNKAVVAVARELAGFIWAVLREYQLRKARQVA